MTNDRAVCTIIAKNYLAFARTLAQSFLAHHPGYKFYVLIVDDFADYLDPAEEAFEIIKLSDLEIPDPGSFCFKYDLKELCTAAKARLLEYLIREKSVSKLLYLDPDILITAPLEKIYEDLETYDIVLTPHLDADYPDDNLLPDDGYILRAGQFNLGFIGVNSSENAGSFLSWWKLKLYEKCVVDPFSGYFVDQKFVDFVPVLFENVLLEKNVGYNVAYWNLHSRRVNKEDQAWTCNGRPLYFFHFSGYNPENEAISKHIPGNVARNHLSSRSHLGKLFAEYKELLTKNGYQQTVSWPYSFGSFNSGESIPDDLRSYYRNLPGKWRGFGDPFRSAELKRLANMYRGSRKPGSRGPDPATTTEQLDAILNSRAWRWVSRYGRFKDRYLTPVLEIFRRFFGKGIAKKI
jgi:lipopolysaccharide biosynthesis glycosyltransferase